MVGGAKGEGGEDGAGAWEGEGEAGGKAGWAVHGGVEISMSHGQTKGQVETLVMANMGAGLMMIG